MEGVTILPAPLWASVILQPFNSVVLIYKKQFLFPSVDFKVEALGEIEVATKLLADDTEMQVFLVC